MNLCTSHKKRKSQCQVVAIVPIHQRDADLYLNQLFKEFDRLDWDVVWHINNMDKETTSKIIDHPRTLGYSLSLDGVFVDSDRNAAVEIAQSSGAPWISPHDADETLEPCAPTMLQDMLKRKHHYVVRWYNIWEVKEDGTLMIRVDGAFMGYKARFYPVNPWKYEYRGVASLYPVGNNWCPREDSWLRILHWGFSTPESRQWHYNRWDGKVSSNYWKMLVLPEFHAQCQLKAFDPNVSHHEFVTT